MLIRMMLVTMNVALGAELALLVTSPAEPTATLEAGDLQLARGAPAPERTAALRPGISATDRHHALTRPLFSPDRRPWVPPVEARAAPEPEPAYEPELEPEADFVLIGIGVARGRARALLTSGAGDDLGWVAEGDTVMDWTVTAISDRSVTIERAEHKMSLDLHADASQE
jgi:hypothetical protein